MNGAGKIRKILTVIVVVIGLILAAAHWGRPAYRHFKEKRGVAQAQAFFAKGDYRNALLSVRQVLMVNSNDLPACRIMAELSDAAHSPATLDWCQRVVQLSPAISNKLLLATAGLRYQGPPYPLTSQVLDDLSAAAAGVPDFHILSAELDLGLHRLTEAETQFEAACRLAPTNRQFQLNLAVIRLGLTNAAAATEARAKLEQLRNDATLGPPALRSLVADRLLRDDASGALKFSTQLLANAQVTLNDRLQNLDILKRLQSPELAGRLKSLQETSSTNAIMTAQLAGWLDANGFRTEAVEWLNHLPAGIAAQSPARIALTECYLAGENWQALRDFASKGSWDETEFLRLAFLSRAWSKLGETVVADGQWRSAVSEADERLGALTALLELANRWQMPREREDLLWRIVKRFPDARWAQASLEHVYFDAGNTAGLYQLYSKQLPRSPQNAALKNNLACTALLLKTNLTQAGQWAAEACAQLPGNPDVVATYAYALHLQGRDREGLATLQKLKPSQREQPSVALYYGVLLRALRQTNEAARFLIIAQTQRSSLPEEKQLLSRTMDELQPSGAP